MLARNRSLVSWMVACSTITSFHRLARMDATAGLHTSHPCPLPWLAIRSLKVLIPLPFHKRNDPPPLHKGEQLLPGVGEVLAQDVRHLLARLLQLGREQVGHQGHAPAAAGP